MLKVHIIEDLMLREHLCKPDVIEMEVDETNVKCFKLFDTYEGLQKRKINLIYWSYKCQKLTDKDYYDYIKENINNFKEYTDKYQHKYLINTKFFAGIEKYSWGILIRFTDGDGVTLEL